MTRQQSEGEVHVEAMRLILAEMERREDVPDWTIWQHMLNMLETIFQGIEDQRDDDRDELMHTRKDRDHWRQARQEAIEAGELMKAELEKLRKELANAQRAVSDAFAEVNSVREQLDAANAAVTLQRAGIERLQAFVSMVRELLAIPLAQISYDDMSVVRAELAALDDEPTPVADRCPECDGSGMVDSGGFGPDGKGINVPCGGDCRGNPCPSQPTPVAEPARCPECERLRAVIDQAWQRIQQSISHADVAGLLAALAEIQSNSSVTLTSSPTPVAEPLDAEGGA